LAGKLLIRILSRLLERGFAKAVPLVDADRLNAAEFVWQGDLAARVQPLLNAGSRIAQEHLSWEYLSTQSTRVEE
jgi:hypothetical protein